MALEPLAALPQRNQDFLPRWDIKGGEVARFQRYVDSAKSDAMARDGEARTTDLSGPKPDNLRLQSTAGSAIMSRRD